MQLQEVITNSGIDVRFSYAQNASMLTHDEIKAELIRQIETGEVKQVDAARFLGIAPARIQEIRNGARRVQPKEMPELAVFLKMAPAEPETGKVVDSVRVPVLGRVAQGMWMEQSEPDPDQSEGVPFDVMRGDSGVKDLFAVVPDGTSMNLQFPPDTHLICRRVPFGSGSYESGKYVIAERSNHDLRELTVKRLEIDAGGVHWLHCESDDPKYQEPWRIGKPDNDHFTDMEVRVIAKVIRAVKIYE